MSRVRRERESLQRRLIRGEHVELDCRFRRTSARGWGPWTDAIVIVGAAPDGAASWHVDDPVTVGRPSTDGPIDADFVEVTTVEFRPVRFQTEAFWGLSGDIIVIQEERATTELALPAPLLHPLGDRLAAQLLRLPDR